jgi:hypothetical protein
VFKRTKALAFLAAASFATGSCLMFVIAAIRALSTPASIWYEGPILGFMASIRDGRLYQETALHHVPYSVLTHTPFSYLVDYCAYRLVPDVRTLRLVNVIATLGCTVLVGYIIWLQTGESRIAKWLGIYFGVSLFLCCTPVFFWSQVARSSDAFACLFALATFAVLLAKRPSLAREVAISVLLAFAIFSKQIEVAVLAPALMAHALIWQRSWIAILERISVAILLLLLAVLWFQYSTHGGFYANVVGGNEVRMQLAWWIMVNRHLSGWWILVIAACAIGAVSRKSPLFVWWVLSLAFGLIGTAKRGADIMYFFDNCAALSIMAGTALAAHSKATSSLAFLCAVLPGSVVMLTQNEARLQSISDSANQDYVQMTKWLKQTPYVGCDQSILSDDASIPMALGRTPVWDDPFVFSEWVATGRWEGMDIANAIRERRYCVIVVTDPNVLWPESFRSLIDQNYQLAEVFHRVLPEARCVYVPRSTDPRYSSTSDALSLDVKTPKSLCEVNLQKGNSVR